jgi:hypothetical protein
MGTATNNSDRATVAVNTVYTGLLALSLAGLLASGVLVYLDYCRYPDARPPAVAKVP